MSKKILYALLIGISISTVLSSLFLLHFFEGWQAQLSDNLFTPRKPHPDIAIIAIDDKSIQAIGRWPWDRSVHARLLTLLGHNPSVVGMDVSFPESSNPLSDQTLAQTLRSIGRVVLPIESNTIEQGDHVALLRGYLTPIPLFFSNDATGLVNMVTDSDGITRQTPINIRATDGKTFDNFSVTIAKKYIQENHLTPLGNVPTANGLMRINFIGRPSTFPTYSFVDVLNGNVAPTLFKGKIVFIGATALDLHDTLLTPVSNGTPMSGVEVHANVIQTLLEKKFLYTESTVATIVTIFLLSITTSLLFAVLGIYSGTLLLGGTLALYIAYAIVSFDWGYIRNLFLPPVAIMAVYVTQVIYKYFVENKQKRFIRKAFSYYLSESVMREVLSDPKKLMLGGIRKEITVLFSDIAGFTTISEDLPPDTLVTLLNTYLTRMTKIVFTNHGVLDKYIGDAVMAFWGAPLEDAKQAIRACHAALEMQEDIKDLANVWANMGIENFQVRIGINTGEMAVGNMGSDHRFDYTLLGDNVNLGSRLEGLNKEYHTKIIISRATYDQVKDDFITRRLDMVAVKGKARGVYVYELRGMGKPTGEEKDFLEAFETARHLYKQEKFKEALALFEKIIRQFPYDFTTKLYVQRCKEFILHPPTTWDGIYHAKSK